MFGLFASKPLLEASSTQWLFDTYAWALENFDADIFYREGVLVQPSNQFFPGRVDSVQGMAELILSQVKGYAGIAHWPTRALDQSSCALPSTPDFKIKGALRGPEGQVDVAVTEDNYLIIPYNPEQIGNPEGLIASFAHTLAHYLGQMARQPPPGGVEYWPQATELLATYLGFGLMFANSAYTFRGGCGSCYNPNANRDAYLTEQQAVYALAIFAVLKAIPGTEVTHHLKGHLRGFYKNAVREIKAQGHELARLSKGKP